MAKMTETVNYFLTTRTFTISAKRAQVFLDAVAKVQGHNAGDYYIDNGIYFRGNKIMTSAPVKTPRQAAMWARNIIGGDVKISIEY